MAGFSFSSTGATPTTDFSKVGSINSSGGFVPSTTPASKALNNATSNSQSSTASLSPGQFGGSIFPQANNQGVKSHTITTSAGDTYKTEYHAPEPGLLTPPQSSFASDSAGGGGHSVISPGGLAAPATQDNTQPITGNTTTPSGAVVNASTGGVVSAPPTSNPTFPGLIGKLSSFNPYNNPLTQSGSQDASQLRNQLRSSINNETNDLNQNRLNPIPIGDQTGRDANIRANYEAQQAGLANTLGYDTSLINSGITGSQQQLTGLTSATSVSAPQLGAYGQTYYSPTQGGAVTPQPQQYTIQQGDTFHALAAQYGTTVEAIEAANPGLDPNNLQVGQPIKLPAGGQFGSGPAAAANVQSVQEQQKIVNDWSASRQAATNIGNQLQQFLQSNNVNPTDFNAVNQFLQLIGKNTSSASYKQFYNLVTDLANTYAPVLSADGNATNYKTELAQSLLDGTAAGQTIPQILTSLDQQAQAKISGYQQNIQRIQSGQNVNPGAQTQSQTNSSPSNSGTVSVLGISGKFVQDSNGVWSYKS